MFGQSDMGPKKNINTIIKYKRIRGGLLTQLCKQHIYFFLKLELFLFNKIEFDEFFQKLYFIKFK